MKPNLPPELRAELAAERDRRQLALLDDVALTVAGFLLAPLTIRAWLDLNLTENHLARRFMIGADPVEFPAPRAELVALLWRLSPHYRARPVTWIRTPVLAWHRRRLERRVARLGPAQRRHLDRALDRLIADAFQDAQLAAEGGERWKPLKPQAPSIVESLIAALGRRYGWPLREIYALPLGAAFALLRADDLARGIEVVDRTNPKIADWLFRAADEALLRN